LNAAITLDFASEKLQLLILSLGGATDVINMFNKVNRCVQDKTMLKCTKNHANRLRRFKDIDSQM